MHFMYALIAFRKYASVNVFLCTLVHDQKKNI